MKNEFSVFFYTVQNFTLAIQSAFEDAIKRLQDAYVDFSSNLKYHEAGANLGKAAMYADEVLTTDLPEKAHELLQLVGIFNYKSGMYLNTKPLNEELAKRKLEKGGKIGALPPKELYRDKILPLQYITGTISAANGDTIARMNREAGTTPLSPAERNDVCKELISAYNEKYLGDASFKDNEFEKGGKIKNKAKIQSLAEFYQIKIGNTYEELESAQEKTIYLIENSENEKRKSDLKNILDYITNRINEKKYSFAKGGLVGFIENNAEKIIKHYLPVADPKEVFNRNELIHPGAYTVDTDTEGDRSKNVFINVAFGSEYEAAEKKINADYNQYANFLEELADKKGYNAEILTSPEDESITFKFSNPRTAKYKRGGQVTKNEPQQKSKKNRILSPIKRN